MAESTFYTATAKETLEQLHTSPTGLDEKSILERVKQYGKNVLPTPKRHGWVFFFFKQLRGFLIIILLVAAGISYILHDPTDAYIILAAVFINVVVGFIQEMKAERALESLKKVITQEAKVVRNGKEQIVQVSELVPGDVLLLDAGDKIPADARLFEISEMHTNEAPLTGESTFIEKQLEPVDASAGVGDRTNMVFTGTTVTKGSGKAVVTQTGVHTEIGRIAQLLHQTADDATPLQKKLDRFAHSIGIVVVGICVALLGVGLLKGMPFVEIFTTAVAIAVSAIPEGLVVAVTIILAIGMQRILKRNALVRNLQAAETLGSTSVICTDKTGTLTEGNMQVVSLMTADYHFDRLHEVERHEDKGLRELIFALNIGMLCNDAHIIAEKSALEEQVIVGNLTERALLAAGMNIGLEQAALNHNEPRIATIPFDSAIKYMATLHKHPKHGHRLYVKGAPERLFGMCTSIRSGSTVKPFTHAQKKKFEEKMVESFQQGLRLLALAYKDEPESRTSIEENDIAELTFVGLVGIKDPLRPNIASTFERTKAAGIHTVMITGDHKLTAQAIAKELGLPADEENIMEGEELHALTQEELNKRVQNISVYARVSPEDKLNIIRAWQSHEKVVAMTGDGVNDSPALKAADIGVALGSGTDVAKETSDMVLLDNRYDTIVAAVEEGRGIFANIRKVLLYLMSDSFSEVLLIAIALFLGIPLPLIAAQILWINLVGDTFPAIALTIDPKEKDIMKEKPRSLRESVMSAEMKIILIAVSLFTAIATLCIFLYFLNTTGNVELARTVVFTALAVDSLPFAFAIRSMQHSIFNKNFFTNPWLIVGVLASFGVQLAALYIPFFQRLLGTQPLGWFEWTFVLAETVGVIALVEIMKYIFKVKKRSQSL